MRNGRFKGGARIAGIFRSWRIACAPLRKNPSARPMMRRKLIRDANDFEQGEINVIHLIRLIVMPILFLLPLTANSACGMWIPCCPDGTPRMGDLCTKCQMEKNCGKPGATNQLQSAGNCVVPVDINASDVWVYRNNCQRNVQIKFTRRCMASDPSTVGKVRSVFITFGSGETRRINTKNEFGGFCSVLAGNTNSDFIEAQYFQ